MKPYYESDLGVLYHGDCIEIARGLECSAHLIVTSPPYDALRRYGGHRFNFRAVAEASRDMLISGGVLVWVIKDQTVNGSETGTAAFHKLYFKDCLGLNIHDTMIYEKNGHAYPSQNRYYEIFEYMIVFSKGSPKTFNPIKDRENKWYGQKWSNKRSRRNFEGDLKDSSWDQAEGERFGVRFNSWKYNVGHGYSSKDKIAFKHPAIFPELLAHDHIVSWSNKGNLVLDPMCGSGTVCKQAEKLNRLWIGIEIEEKYCEITAKRIEKEREQRKLFR